MQSVPFEQALAEALARFNQSGSEHINCGQAVLCFALLRLGEDPELIAEAKYFGGGISGMGEICGAMNGLTLALGVRDRVLREQGVAEPPTTADALKAILSEFGQEFGHCRCADLTGHDLRTPEGMDAFKQSDIRSRCVDYVGWACARLDPLLQPVVQST